jgi:RHS repeat-associated protein
MLSETDPLGHVASYVYNGAGEMVSETDADGDTTKYAYDGDGQLLSLTDPDGNVTSYAYDALGRETSETNASGSETYQYNALGEVTEQTDRDGHVTTYAYDGLGNETAENWLDTNGNVIHTDTYSYDADNELLSASDSTGGTDTYTYDADGEVASQTQQVAGLAPTVTLNEQYDAEGDRTQLSATIGGTADLVNNYTYDAIGEMTQVAQSGVSGGNAVAEKRVDFGYNSDGQFSTISRYADVGGAELVATSTYGYDSAGRLTSLNYAQGTTTLVGYTWSYDAASDVTQMTNTIDGTANYSYDPTGELTGATYSPLPSAGEGQGEGSSQAAESYSYDSNGNRQTANGSTCTTGANNEILNDGTYTYTYDADGNCTSRTCISTASSDDYITLYAWDYRNRLTSVTNENNAGQVTQTVTYTYDAFDRLVGRTLSIPGQANQNTAFVYDGQQILEQFDGTGSGNLTAANLSHRYLWGPAVDQLMADEQVTTPGQAGQVVWALTDNLGTVRDLAVFNSATNTTTIVNHRTFDAFGNMLSQTNPATGSAAAVDCLFGFTGLAFDNATGMNITPTRPYNPADGRWLQPDPSEISAGDPNFNRYCGNDPINRIDPSGLGALWPDGSPIGGYVETAGFGPVNGHHLCGDKSGARRATDMTPEQWKRKLDSFEGRGSPGWTQPGGNVFTFSGPVEGAVLFVAEVPQNVFTTLWSAFRAMAGDETGGPIMTQWGWRGSNIWRDAVKLVDKGGTIEDIGGKVPTEAEATQLIEDGGGTFGRIEGAHPAPNPHQYPHINYTTSGGAKGTIKIQ